MSDPQDQERLLTEIRDTHREHLAEYRRVTSKILENQELAVKRVRKGMRWLIVLIVVLAIIWMIGPNGPALCFVNALRGGPSVRTGSAVRRLQTDGPETVSYRFTPEQLEEIRDAEQRFTSVNSITSLVAALGEPDAVVDTNYGPEGAGYGGREYRYSKRWKTIDVQVYQFFGGNFTLRASPKASSTQPS